MTGATQAEPGRVPAAASVLAFVAAGLSLSATVLSGIARGLGGEASDASSPIIFGHEWVWLVCALAALVLAFVLPLLPRLAAALLATAAIIGWLAPFPVVGTTPGLYVVWAVPAAVMLVAAGLTWRSIHRWRSSGACA